MDSQRTDIVDSSFLESWVANSNLQLPEELELNQSPSFLPNEEQFLASAAYTTPAEPLQPPAAPQNTAVTGRKRKRNDLKQERQDDLEFGEEDSDEDVGKREKNRKASQLFRQRQRAHIGELQQEVDHLTRENADFKSKAELLTAENNLIKEQLSYLRNFIAQAVALAFPMDRP